MKNMTFPGWKPASYADYEPLEKYLRVITKISSQKSKYERFGSFPYMLPKQLAHRMSPVVKGISQSINKILHFRTTLSYERFRNNLSEEQYEVALIQPYDYALAEQHGYELIARMDDLVGAAFYVKNDAKIQTLEQLKQQLVAFPPSGAAVSILGRNLLLKNNININQDLKLRYRRSHLDCVNMLQTDQAASCVTAPFIIEQVLEPESVKHIRIIAKSKEIPSIGLIAHKRLGNEKINTIKKTVINWKNSLEGKNILAQARLKPFIPVSDVILKQYQELQIR